MTKYEELLGQLAQEKARLLQDFNTKAEVGHFAIKNNIIGVLSKKTPTGYFIFYPIQTELMSTMHHVLRSEILTEDIIPQVKLLGNDCQVVGEYFQALAREKFAIEQEVPF